MRLLILLALLSPLLSMCQALTLKGKIINEQGSPIPGATITLKRPLTPNAKPQTPNSAPSSVISHLSSDANGEFSLTNLHLNDTLLISAIGYEPYTLIYDHTYARYPQTTVWLKRRIGQLEEVVVNTGYQTLPKERATGSFTHISSQRLNEQVSTDILSRLEGVAAGFMVDRKTRTGGQLMIRGLSTITGPRDPLIVVDNFPFEGAIASLNPADVESITILKDAAAASVWGARAGNGVIVITTKKAAYGQPLRVELTSNYTLSGPPSLQALPVMSSSEFVDVEEFLFSKGYRWADTASTARPLFSPAYEILFRARNGSLSEAEARAQLDALRQHDVRDDFARYVYGHAWKQQQALTLRGGSATNTWLFSAGWDKNRSHLADDYSRLTFRLGNTARLRPNLELALTAFYLHTTSRVGRTGYGGISNSRGAIPPYTALADAAGNALPLARTYRQVFTDTAGGGRLLAWDYYPLLEPDLTRNQSTTHHLVADGGLTWKPVHGLALSLKYRLERESGENEILYNQQSYFVRNLVNQYTQLNRVTGAVTNRVPRGDILDETTTAKTAQNGRAELVYNRQWNRHTVAAMGGFEARQATGESRSGRTYGFNNEILTAVNVDYATAFPTYINGTLSFIPSGWAYDQTLTRFVSFFGNGAYTYKGRYTLSLSGRKDASNLFGLNTNQKWNPLWSVGAAWELSKEAFWQGKALPFLKLRATYGFSGNIDPSMSAVTTIGYATTSPYTGTPTARVDKFYNPDLRWEQVRMINFGIDFRTANGRIGGSLDYFRKRSTDLFGSVPVDPTHGLGVLTLRKNVAATRGEGFDLDITIRNTEGRLAWTTAWNLSGYWDEVTSFYLASQAGSQFVGNGPTGIIGRSLYSVFGYSWAGLDPATGDPQGLYKGALSKDYTALTGSTTTIDDLVYKGRGLPTVYGGLGNTLQWKGLSLTARISYKLGYLIRRTSLNYTSLFASNTTHSDYSLRWQTPGDEQHTDVPSMTYPANSRRDAFYTGAEVLVTRGDHIRLQYLTLAWDWAGGHAQRLPWQNLRLALNAANLGILWRANRFGIDPDFPGTTLPPAPAYAFSVQATF